MEVGTNKNKNLNGPEEPPFEMSWHRTERFGTSYSYSQRNQPNQ